MKNISFTIAILVAVSQIFVLGCQTFRVPRWHKLSKKNALLIRGQAPCDDPFSNVPSLTPPATHAAFEPLAPVQPSTSNSDSATEATERDRIKAIATAPRFGLPVYLQPFNPWDGPFADHNRKKNLEHDFIQQAGYEPVAVRTYSEEPVFDWEKEEPKKGFDWTLLDPSKSFSKARDLIGLGPDQNKANESMKKGRDILSANPDLKDQKKNLEAAKHFAEAGKRYPDSLLEEDSLHLAGECYFFADDYYHAYLMYQKLMIKYPHSKYVDNGIRRLFRIAQYWELAAEKGGGATINVTDKSLPRYDTFGFAKKAYETIFTYDPNGPISDDALMALATAYMKKGRYQGDDNYNQAAYYYQQLREEHPLSKHIAKAYEYELYARTQAYLGAEHPGRTLEEARKLAGITMRQFGNELDSEAKAGIMEIREEILAKEAERLWEVGQFYDIKKRHYGSAKLYYERLIIEYPQTQYAEKARKRMKQIENLPDVPSMFSFPLFSFKGAR